MMWLKTKGEMTTPHVRRVKYDSRGQIDNLPPLNHRAGYQANEGIAVPSRHRTATVDKESGIS